MNLSIIYRQFGEIYRLGVPQRRASARLGRTNSSAESTDNRLMFRKKRPMPVAKLASQNVSPIYHQTAIIYHLGSSSEELTCRESSSNRQAKIANLQPIGKRFSLIGKPTAIVRSATGQLQQTPPERGARDAGKVPTVSAQLEVTND